MGILLVLLLSGYLFNIYNIGNAFILFVYIIPFIYFILKPRLLISKKLFIRNIGFYIKKHRLTIVLFYFLYTSTFLSIISSILPSMLKEKNIDLDKIPDLNMKIIKVFSLVIESSGIMLILFALLIFFLSHYINKIIEEIMEYEPVSGGYKDPITGEENISLRYGTFKGLLNAVDNDDEIAKIGLSIGKEFGKNIVEKHQISDFNELKLKWLQTDTKAGFLENIDISGTNDNKKISLINFTNTFAKRIDKDIDTSCIFFENYVKGIIIEYYTYNEMDITDLEVTKKQAICSDCSNNNNCHIDIN